MAEGYRSRLHNDVVPLAPRRPSSIASAIGRGLGMLGDAAGAMARDNAATEERRLDSEHRIGLEEQRRERSRRAVSFGAKLAEQRLAYQRWQGEARAQTAPGAPEWEARAQEKIEELFGPLLDEFGDDEELATRLAPAVQSTTATLLSQEIAWEADKRAEWEGDSFKTLLDTERDGLLGTPPEAVGEALGASMGRIDAVLGETDFDGTVKERLRALALRQLASDGALEGLAQSGNYEAIGAILDSGELDGALGDDKANWLKTVAAGREAQAKEAEQAEAAKRDEWRDQWDVIEGRLERGEDVPQSEIKTFLELGKNLGVEASELQEAGYLTQDTAYARAARTKGDAVLGREIGALEAKRREGAASAEELRYLERLQKEQKARDGKAGNGIKELASAGAAGQAAAAGQLAGMDPERRWAAAREAGDTRLAVYAAFNPAGRAFAAQGREVRKARPDDFLPPARPGGKSGKEQADAIFRAQLGGNLVHELGGAYDDVREAALDAMAGMAGGWNADNFRLAVQFAYGASRRDDDVLQGGIGTVRGRRVELPRDMTAAEFDGAFARGNFAAARYANGQPASKADILANFRPVATGEPGKYMFLDAKGRALLREGGGPFVGKFGGSR